MKLFRITFSFFILFFTASVPGWAQETDSTAAVIDNKSDDNLMVIVEEMPEYPGGEQALLSFIASNIKYPQYARENDIQGVVYASFVVGKDGSIRNVKIIRGLDPDCDKEVLRVLSLMSSWKPGKQQGKYVSVLYNIPVRFSLVDRKSKKKAKNKSKEN